LQTNRDFDWRNTNHFESGTIVLQTFDLKSAPHTIAKGA